MLGLARATPARNMAELSARNLVLDTAVQEGVPEQDLPADAFDDQNDETRQVEHTVSRQLEEIGNEIDPGLRNTEIANEATNSREGVQGFFQNWRDMLLNETTLRRAASLFSVAGRLVKEFLRYTTREITLGQLLGWIVQALHDEAMPRVRQWVQVSATLEKRSL